MKGQEVIKYIENHGYIADDVKDIAIKAIEKQIPKRTVKKTWWHECPCCGNDDISEQYCDRCGQKLDWGNENDD